MLKNVSKELLEKVQKAKTKDAALDILKQGGVELTEEDLQGVSGGEGDSEWCWDCKDHCGFYGCTVDCQPVCYDHQSG